MKLSALYQFQIKDVLKSARRRQRKRTLTIHQRDSDKANDEKALMWN